MDSRFQHSMLPLALWRLHCPSSIPRCMYHLCYPGARLAANLKSGFSCTFSSARPSQVPATSSTAPGSQHCSLKRSAVARAASAQRLLPREPRLSTRLTRLRSVVQMDQLSRVEPRLLTHRGFRPSIFSVQRRRGFAAARQRPRPSSIYQPVLWSSRHAKGKLLHRAESRASRIRVYIEHRFVRTHLGSTGCIGIGRRAKA